MTYIEFTRRSSDDSIACCALNQTTHQMFGSLELDWLPDQNRYWMARCSVKPSHRNQGIGTDLMRMACYELDRRQSEAFLIPNPYDATITFDGLVAFYERFGFVREDDYWVRKPQSVERSQLRNVGKLSAAA